MAETFVKRGFILFLTFMFIICCAWRCYAKTAEHVLQREKRDLIDSYEFPRNIKAFYSPAEIPNTNQISEVKVEKSLVQSLPAEADGAKISVRPYSECPALRVCCDLQAELAKSTADFDQCAIMHARPITLCLNCVVPYNKTINVHQQLIEASENGTKCKDVFFGKDKLEVANRMYDNVISLWNEGNCNNCYETKDGAPDYFAVSNETLNFKQALKKVSDCFEEIKLLGNAAVDNPNNTCSECKSVYEHLNDIFKNISEDMFNPQISVSEVCADITDAMNVTHHLWNNQFKCHLFGKHIGYALYVVTVSLTAVPILFYLAAKVLSNAETIYLVLPKRKPFVQESARLQM